MPLLRQIMANSRAEGQRNGGVHELLAILTRNLGNDLHLELLEDGRVPPDYSSIYDDDVSRSTLGRPLFIPSLTLSIMICFFVPYILFY